MNFDAGNEDLAFATPRSWEMVSNILNGIDDDVENMYSLIAGIVALLKDEPYNEKTKSQTNTNGVGMIILVGVCLKKMIY